MDRDKAAHTHSEVYQLARTARVARQRRASGHPGFSV